MGGATIREGRGVAKPTQSGSGEASNRISVRPASNPSKQLSGGGGAAPAQSRPVRPGNTAERGAGGRNPPRVQRPPREGQCGVGVGTRSGKAAAGS